MKFVEHFVAATTVSDNQKGVTKSVSRSFFVFCDENHWIVNLCVLMEVLEKLKQ